MDESDDSRASKADQDLEKVRMTSQVARSSLWTVRLEEVPKDHISQCRNIVTCQKPEERWGVAGPPGVIKATATVVLPAVLGTAAICKSN